MWGKAHLPERGPTPSGPVAVTSSERLGLTLASHNPYLRGLSTIGYIGMVLGVILIFVGFSNNPSLLAIGVSVFGLGFLTIVAFLVASAISWNAWAIATDEPDNFDE